MLDRQLQLVPHGDRAAVVPQLGGRLQAAAVRLCLRQLVAARLRGAQDAGLVLRRDGVQLVHLRRRAQLVQERRHGEEGAAVRVQLHVDVSALLSSGGRAPPLSMHRDRGCRRGGSTRAGLASLDSSGRSSERHPCVELPAAARRIRWRSSPGSSGRFVKVSTIDDRVRTRPPLGARLPKTREVAAAVLVWRARSFVVGGY